jgi:UDP-N-acetylmuramate--alanine ligase
MTINIDMDTISRVHFVGIGGAGMGGIAEVVVNQGYDVSGSDLSDNTVTKHLKELGVTIIHGHQASNVTGADLVVTSTAVPANNPEVIAAKEANIPVIPRAKMLALLMQRKYGIAISGTHGKTTTTSLVASVLAQADLHPTFVIGGLLKSVGANAQLGTGEYFVAEADESDASFLFLKPKIAVITNIDEDHLSTYNGQMSELRRSFLEFVSGITAEGAVILCADDPIASSLIAEIKAPVITYGFCDEADLQITDFQQRGLESHFRVINKLEGLSEVFVLNLPGKHNVLNATASYAVARKLGVAQTAVKNAFQNFMGIGRRFQLHGDVELATGKALIIDDYGHHPREIAATVDAIRLVWPQRRLVMAYQPHRYTRTLALMQDFAAVLSTTDVLLLLEVYSAGEALIPGADGMALCQAVISLGKVIPKFVSDVELLPQIAKDVLQDGDILLIQGAGSIGSVAAKMACVQVFA